MTDLAAADAPEVSTTLDPQAEPSPSGGGQPRTLAEEPKEPTKPASLRDTIADEVNKGDKAKDETAPDPKANDERAQEGEDEKKPAKAEDAKPKEEVKPEAKRAEDGKFAAKQPEGEPDAKADKPNGHIEPPRNFLPDAKETWRNTPRAVQRDVENTIRQHEQEVTRYRETAQRYEPLRRYDDLARQNGGNLEQSLQRVVHLETLMKSNPVAALNQALLQAGPRKPDGQPYSLFEVAQVIVQKGQQGYQQMVAQQPQKQQQPANENSEVAQLKQQLAQLQEQQIEASVIAPFKAAHPRFAELEEDIAFFLQSGKISPSLSLSDRLEAAYDMAARINPASHAEPSTPASPDPGRRADDDLSGTKSIKSAPGAVSQDMEPDRGGSIQDVLRAELKRARRA